MTALNKAYTELQHPEKLTPEQVKFDVLVLFHLCGDLTQPLHVGYGSDKGGNTYQVQYNGRGTNLHSIWDSRIVDEEKITYEGDIKQQWGYWPKQMETGKQPVIFTGWLQDSRDLLPVVYAVQGHKIDAGYFQKNRKVVIEQIKAGGTLLAICLETLFKKATNIPVGPATTLPSAIQKPANTGKAITNAGTITPDQAAAHIGEQVTVCGKVYSTKLLAGGPTFINMGGEYPDNTFTAVIMFNKRTDFSYKPEEYLQGKTICITGTIKNYKGKPEIVVEKEEQVKTQ